MIVALWLPASSVGQQPEPFTPLFNGQNLDGWDTNSGWDEKRVTTSEGVLGLNGDSGWLLAEKTYYDFVLRFEARAKPGSIGGVLLRALPAKGRPYGGYELRVADERNQTGSLLVRRGSAILHALPSDPTVRTTGDWQAFTVECRGDTLRVRIDGQEVHAVRGLVHNLGRVGLHVEAGAVEFRNIEIQKAPLPKLRPALGVALPGEGGVTMPVLQREAKPEYSPEALRAGVQGEVWLQCVVLATGKVGDITVVRSLRADLDAKAVAAAKKWRFRPSVKDGEPVPVLVTISMSFTLQSVRD